MLLRSLDKAKLLGWVGRTAITTVLKVRKGIFESSSSCVFSASRICPSGAGSTRVDADSSDEVLADVSGAPRKLHLQNPLMMDNVLKIY
jgi:hypothetical protein